MLENYKPCHQENKKTSYLLSLQSFLLSVNYLVKTFISNDNFTILFSPFILNDRV